MVNTLGSFIPAAAKNISGVHRVLLFFLPEGEREHLLAFRAEKADWEAAH